MLDINTQITDFSHRVIDIINFERPSLLTGFLIKYWVKLLLRQRVSELEIYGLVVYKLQIIMDVTVFFLFRKVIIRCKILAIT